MEINHKRDKASSVLEQKVDKTLYVGPEYASICTGLGYTKVIWKCSVLGDKNKNFLFREMSKTKHSLIN